MSDIAKKNGGPAFPIWTDDMPIDGSDGMSLRDWFAGMAMQAMALRHNTSEVASDAFAIADAMIAEREKQ